MLLYRVLCRPCARNELGLFPDSVSITTVLVRKKAKEIPFEDLVWATWTNLSKEATTLVGRIWLEATMLSRLIWPAAFTVWRSTRPVQNIALFFHLVTVWQAMIMAYQCVPMEETDWGYENLSFIEFEGQMEPQDKEATWG